jgi:hypothetical protein
MQNPHAHTKDGRLPEVLDLLTRGAWEEAHAIVQRDKSPEAAWLHGIVHAMEGDLENARHWYGKANRAFPGAGAVTEELAAARARFTETIPLA